MDIIYSEKHKLRDSLTELYGGELVYPHERPSRLDFILRRINEVSLGSVISPFDFGLGPIIKIHDEDFVHFLKVAWSEWQNEGFRGEAIATNWPARRMSKKCPSFIEGKLGYYSLASETSISEGTWEASYASAQVALTAAERVRIGERSCFALCRPPGHHATPDMYGGYCFLNNAAISAQYLRDKGAKKIAVLDIDFHHGNGTQDIFFKRNDILFVSLHGDPMEAFPYYLGHADETGSGAGEGYNLNLPMPPSTTFEVWRKSLQTGLEKIVKFRPDVLIVSLGVDTYENDPISFFKLKSNDFFKIGLDISQIGFPTLFIMEGGYNIKEIGVNVVNVLSGFERAVFDNQWPTQV